MSQKTLWIASILLLALATAVVLQGIGKEMSRIDIVPEDELTVDAPVEDELDVQAPLDTDIEADGFFESYRLERERTRSQEEETLTALINNANASESAKRDAETKLLQLTDDVENEIRIENMIKAMGFKQVVFFRRGDEANVVLKAAEVSDQQFLEITQIVSQIADVDPHAVNLLFVD